MQNGIPEEDVYKYTAQRLRQIGHTLSAVKAKPADPTPPEIKEPPPKQVSEQENQKKLQEDAEEVKED